VSGDGRVGGGNVRECDKGEWGVETVGVKSEMEDIFMSITDWRKEEQERAAKGKEYLLSLIPSLKAAGVKCLVVHYNGEGDSGEIEGVRAYSDRENEVEVTVTFDEERVSGAASDVIAGKGIDWYNNEGGFGDVVLFTKGKGSIKIEHNYRVESSTYHEVKV